MGFIDTAKIAAVKATGQVKQKPGAVRGDEQLQADQSRGSVKQTGGNVEDVFE
ncbi:CsbD family protein [Kineococcus rubinsiae]|uniref:CsbD family protein n=1 Tax=Kineococcus rubinsiae TaxID=2609562 RepID=UPI001430A851|nr:CsbD family protein [Kineococcus rubinsiae]NIZ90375.1 CsbD family protein [Kineococcus rubinsiae]